MSIVKKGGLAVLLFVVVAVLVTGCMPGRAASINPGWTVVTADAETVYAALPDGRVVALGAANGQEVWVYPVPQEQSGGGGLGKIFSAQEPSAEQPLDGVYGSPVLTENLLLVPSYNQHLYAFNLDASAGQVGSLAWQFAAEGAIVGGVTVYDGVAYFGSSDHNVYAVDVATGQPVWEKPFATENSVWGAPAVDDQRVYVGSMDHYVYAVDRATGQQIWREELSGSVVGGVVLDEGRVFVGGVDKKLHALDANTGDLLWASEDLGGWVWGEPLIYEGYAYVNSLNGKVYAFAVADGAPRWAQAVTVEGALRAGPVLLDGQLVVGTETGNLYTITMETGEQAILYKAGAGILSTPVVVDNMVYAGTATGNVYALDANKGTAPLAWVYPPAREK
ncbi:MAG: PQQ-binding-like beta-propeller repeat protein [Chloroflexi bacterium]|nr:PQQ-binding-like beta-propeller repeat protein [Chloroflexota bacterium]